MRSGYSKREEICLLWGPMDETTRAAPLAKRGKERPQATGGEVADMPKGEIAYQRAKG